MNARTIALLPFSLLAFASCSPPTFVGEEAAEEDRRRAAAASSESDDDSKDDGKESPSRTDAGDEKPVENTSADETTADEEPTGNETAEEQDDTTSAPPAADDDDDTEPAPTMDPQSDDEAPTDPEPEASTPEPEASTPEPDPGPGPGPATPTVPRESTAVLLEPDGAIPVADADLPSYSEWPFNGDEAANRQTETAEALGVPPAVYIELGDGIRMEFVLVPAGRSVLGCPDTTAGYEADEMLRDVEITRPFYLAITQVTREQFRAVMGVYPENDPFSFVKMTDSPLEPALQAYFDMRDNVMPKIQAKAPEGWTIRLPTEDEWEHATRAGTGTIWYTGDTEEDLARIGWYNHNSEDKLHDVALLEPNAWGLYDMVGNAWHYAFRATGWYSDEDLEAHIVRGGDCQSEAFGNGCRTSNYQIQMVTAGYRFALDLP